ncbi:hypothetical protein QVD17_20662 [Tagetes erecta]|uniref:Uncharacterized protein n=1 Tax=Tagetes erecta TaxID=13708 RepID=A0AAD8NYF1_TARER|nr:hypothetical protein QVD17_20662 [Tagetes erecta]
MFLFFYIGVWRLDLVFLFHRSHNMSPCDRVQSNYREVKHVRLTSGLFYGLAILPIYPHKKSAPYFLKGHVTSFVPSWLRLATSLYGLAILF